MWTVIFLIILFIIWKNRHLLFITIFPLLALTVLVSLFGSFFIGMIIFILIIWALFEMSK